MAIFPKLQLESVVQVDDKTRLDGIKSFVTSDEAAITLIELEVDSGDGFIDITNDIFYDFQYPTDGDKTVSLRITTDGAPITATATLPIISAVDDNLFSSDAELRPYEPNILDWIKEGRSSFLDVHRAAQDRIITYLDENGFWDQSGAALTKDAVVDIAEVNDWSKFMVLKLIFEGLSNATDDIFHEKALRYRKMEYTARDRAKLRLDVDGDAVADETEAFDFRAIEMLKE